VNGGSNVWVHRGFEDFAQGRFGSGGDNLYVNAKGVIETIHRTDVNNDGFVDIVLPNSHGYMERGPTWIYTQGKGEGHTWPRRELPNDSGWMSRIMDVDGDGYPDLIVVNGENGVTSELHSYVYWGGSGGLTGERTELPTAGAYDVAAVDLTGSGRLSLLFPSAWVDHHNRGKTRLVQVYAQIEPRRFVDVSEKYSLAGVAAVSIACDDLNGDGRPELVVCNYRQEYQYDIESFVYWGAEDGFDTRSPLRLPSHYAMQVTLDDLDGDGRKEIILAGGNRIYIYWNDEGRFSPDNRTILEAEGNSTMFAVGAIRVAVADVDGDGSNELLVAMRDGVQIRSPRDLTAVQQFLPLPHCGWLEAVDLDGDGRPEIIASKYQDGRTYETESAIFWNGPGGFSPPRVTWLPTRGAVGCTAGDLDGDGRPEVIFNNTMGGLSQFNPDFPLYVYLGSEDGQYSADRRLELPTGGGTNTYVVANFDLDGYADLAISSSDGLRVFHGGPDGLRPDRYTVLKAQGQPFGYVLVADLNRDGWLDLLAVPWTYDTKPETMANSSVIFWGGPDGFSAERSTGVPTYCQGNGHLADVNNDGWLDFIYGDSRGYLRVYLGGPDGFSSERMWRIPLEGTDVATVASINSADLNGDGWLDLIVAVMGHYTRKQSGFFLLYGGPDGFIQERTRFHATDASSVRICVADVNRDGYLDLLVPAYSTQFSRELPAHIFWGNGDRIDFANPLVIPCDSSCAFMAVDITGNGYPDVLAVCHRNDLGHQVDSLLFWNGSDGLSFDRVSRLPGLGPHLASSRDFGNAFTREPFESYISPPHPLGGQSPARISWDADVPDQTALKFQLRWAETEPGLESAPWRGPDGEKSFYERPGQEIGRAPTEANWMQYKAVFFSLNGCHSPGLRQVTIDLIE
jgi:hypothetical protein